ncbi:MAG: hypothetical protein EWM72_03251 [Nitrospira sp.]|nr:MAG: hypothetical protein EWM72_03251 [Nitrospira sp.]
MGSRSSKDRPPRRPVFYLTTFDSTLSGRGRSFGGAKRPHVVRNAGTTHVATYRFPEIPIFRSLTLFPPLC